MNNNENILIMLVFMMSRHDYDNSFFFFAWDQRQR